MIRIVTSSSFFFNDPSTSEIYTLSLHDALPIFEPIAEVGLALGVAGVAIPEVFGRAHDRGALTPDRILVVRDRKSTRLNSSHQIISYAVFCLKKKKICRTHTPDKFDTMSTPLRV